MWAENIAVIFISTVHFKQTQIFSPQYRMQSSTSKFSLFLFLARDLEVITVSFPLNLDALPVKVWREY